MQLQIVGAIFSDGRFGFSLDLISSCSDYKFPKSTELRRNQDVKWKILRAIPAFRSEESSHHNTANVIDPVLFTP